MNDFRGPLPLDDRDFAEVRRKVLAKIERRPPVIGWMLAAAAALALIVIFVPRPQAPAPRPVQARKPARVIVAPPQPKPAPVEIAVKPQPPKKKTPQPQPQPQLVADKGAPPSDEEITMNIQTADPNVRIIWIARR